MYWQKSLQSEFARIRQADGENAAAGDEGRGGQESSDSSERPDAKEDEPPPEARENGDDEGSDAD